LQHFLILGIKPLGKIALKGQQFNCDTVSKDQVLNVKIKSIRYLSVQN
jgi:hypothetical protein